jgi:mRNA-degrading endonuclease YafQ of YafQ-DinJ toxin-antitoxin module
VKAVRIDGRLLKRIRSKPKPERLVIGKAIAEAQRSFGKPHQHRGIGLRKLIVDYYEIRVGLDQRLIFRATPDLLSFEFLGSHDEVRKFLKSR